MHNYWYKASNDLTHDDTLKLVSLRANIPHGNVIAVWIVLLERCSKRGNNNPEINKFFYDEVSLLLGYKASEIKVIIENLQYYELIKDGEINNWERHQVKTSSERVKKWRERKQNETQCNVTPVTCNTVKRNVTHETHVTARKEKKRKEKKKENNNNSVIIKEKDSFQLPEGINKEDWSEFEDMRRKIKKPMTLRAKKMLLNKLLAINQEYGDNPNEVLQQSILHCYDVVYPLKRQNNYEQKTRNYPKKESSSDVIERGLRDIDFSKKINIF